jgi:hypothetical protein
VAIFKPFSSAGHVLYVTSIHPNFLFNCDSISYHHLLQYLIPTASSLSCLLLSFRHFLCILNIFLLLFTWPDKFESRQPYS